MGKPRPGEGSDLSIITQLVSDGPRSHTQQSESKPAFMERAAFTHMIMVNPQDRSAGWTIAPFYGRKLRLNCGKAAAPS